jgi:hypothetical protein
MLRNRSTWLIALTFGVVALVATPARTADLEKAGPTLDVLTPADAQMVMSFNLRQVVDSPLAKKKGYVQKLKDLLDAEPQAKEVLKAIGLDPFKDIESMTVAMPIPENPGAKAEKAMIVIRGNFDQDKIEAALKKEAKVKTSKEGTRTIYEIKGDGAETVFGTFVNKNTIAAAPSKDYLVNSLKGGKPNAALLKSVSGLTGKESMWMGVMLTDEMRKQMKANPQTAAFGSLESVATTVNVTDAITFDVYLNADNAENAGKMEALVNQFLPLIGAFAAGDEKVGPIFKKIMNNLKVSVKGNAVNINVKLTEDIIDDLIKLSQMK